MKYFKKIYVDAYYFFAKLIFKKKALRVPDFLRSTTNVFFYFDYEREFGGHKTEISDQDILFLLKLLEEYHIKTTWFTVGKILEKYPESVQNILSHGHEIGSHTYAHLAPLRTPGKILKNDFKKYAEIAESKNIITGFHSPNGLWNTNSIRLCSKNNYSYDVISCKKSSIEKPYMLTLSENKRIVRLNTIGDDWLLYKSNYSENEVLQFFIKNSTFFNQGNILGFGFHPWVLFSDENFLKGFKKFLKYIKTKENIRIETAGFFAEALSKNIK
ncbi:MAG TPA: hypothetical protein DCG75_17570 [Bacteroidales bacterium]|nr:hypothetical protein [Bacteroidales bacterium]